MHRGWVGKRHVLLGLVDRPPGIAGRDAGQSRRGPFAGLDTVVFAHFFPERLATDAQRFCRSADTPGVRGQRLVDILLRALADVEVGGQRATEDGASRNFYITEQSVGARLGAAMMHARSKQCFSSKLRSSRCSKPGVSMAAVAMSRVRSALAVMPSTQLTRRLFTAFSIV